MRAPLYQVDAFTAQNFSGNAAAVLVLAAFPPAVDMQAIAAENNLAETAFIVPAAGIFASDGSLRPSKFPYAGTRPSPARP